MTSLLPPNSTDLERKLAEAGKDAFDLPSIRIIKDIDQVPSQFLPFIAWQKSVDYCDENWQEELKRKVIKESRDLHRLKGTPAAIKKALEPFGYEVNIIEWFEVEPNLVPGTFKLEIDLIGKPLNSDTTAEINRLVGETKAASRHVTDIQFTTNSPVPVYIATGYQRAVTVSSYTRSI